jgi:protein tyrosine phosphatase (PTP) superfamily phosphohydrolase (DUF442 family)
VDLNGVIHYMVLKVEGFPLLGTAGQPSPEQYPSIAAAGYETVINLALPTSTGALEDEAGLASSLGLEYVHIPVIWEAPQTADLERFFETLQGRRGRKVFVHCAKNYRASAFLYLYRVRFTPVPEEDARWDMLTIWEPEGVWNDFIERGKKFVFKS